MAFAGALRKSERGRPIGVAFVLVRLHWGTCAWYRRRIVLPASALIACTAVYWTFERLSF